jgi:DUF4097 and DUF4098 domain-containing protein YvlB
METSVYWNGIHNMKSRIVNILATLLCGVLLASSAAAQEKVNVTLTDPTRPPTVKVNLLTGSITVKAHALNTVVVEAKARNEERRRNDTKGMKRIPMTAAGLNVEEENNKVSISTESLNRATDITVLVPVKSSLILRTVNDGDINVVGVDGDIDVNDVNGEVYLENIAGAAVAHALNGDVRVTFTRINAKPMSFSSLNGDIDVTFPADLKATLNLRTDNGEVLSDFDVAMQPAAPKVTEEDSRKTGGRYRVKVEKSVKGSIGGGGPEMNFKNFNGNIYIRKVGVSKTDMNRNRHHKDKDDDDDDKDDE